MSYLDSMGNFASSAYSSIPAGGRYRGITYSPRLIRRVVPQLVASRMFTTQPMMSMCGTAVSRRTQLHGSVQTTTEDDGFLKPQPFTHPKELLMDIEYGAAAAHKFSEQDEMCYQSMDEDFIGELLDADEEVAMELLDSIAIGVALTSVHKANKGHNAGARSGAFDLGTPSNPIPFNPDTAKSVLNGKGGVLRDWNFAEEEVPFLIVPALFESVILENDHLSSWYHQGTCNSCPYVTGRMNNQVMGFDPYVSSCLKPIAPGSNVYPLLFGYRSQGDMMMNFKRRRISGTVPGDLSVHYEAWWHFAVKTFDPRKLGVCWVEIQLN